MKKRTTLTLAILATSSLCSPAQTPLPEGSLSDINVERSGTQLLVNLTVNPSAFTDRRNRETELRPMMVAGADTLRLQPVTVAGRTRYYQHLRQDDGKGGYTLLRAGHKKPYRYSAVVPYENWMEYARLVVEGEIDGCCGEETATISPEDIFQTDFREKVLSPIFTYVKPTKVIEKTRTVTGKAYIDFPVNKTAIYPDYRRNPEELAKIRQTIDEVRGDRDVTITSLSFKGYASPEGPYLNNERLAKGRTLSLIKYVEALYNFPHSLLHEAWEAENWVELDSIIRATDTPDKERVLALVNNTTLSPDGRENELKLQFPKFFEYLKQDVFPGMRRTDYDVVYLVRDYTDITEIAEVMRTQPQKLSLNELFLYAQSLDKNSPEFREVMEVSVRMYPDDPEANLNAAVTAIDHGEYDLARQYLAKAGDGAIATYTRGVLEAKLGNYTAAAKLLSRAEAAGVAEATDLLAQMRSFGWI